MVHYRGPEWLAYTFHCLLYLLIASLLYTWTLGKVFRNFCVWSCGWTLRGVWSNLMIISWSCTMSTHLSWEHHSTLIIDLLPPYLSLSYKYEYTEQGTMSPYQDRFNVYTNSVSFTWISWISPWQSLSSSASPSWNSHMEKVSDCFPFTTSTTLDGKSVDIFIVSGMLE